MLTSVDQALVEVENRTDENFIGDRTVALVEPIVVKAAPEVSDGESLGFEQSPASAVGSRAAQDDSVDVEGLEAADGDPNRILAAGLPLPPVVTVDTVADGQDLGFNFGTGPAPRPRAPAPPG